MTGRRFVRRYRRGTQLFKGPSKKWVYEEEEQEVGNVVSKASILLI